MKVQIVITQTETAVLDIGDIPLNAMRDLLLANNGTFDGNWGLGDAVSDVEFRVTDVNIQEVKGREA